MMRTPSKWSHRTRLTTSIAAVAAAGTIMIAASLAWNLRLLARSTVDEARIQAEMAYEEDIVYRRWNTRHGGVYVPITGETRPDPYLAAHPDRDVVTSTGRVLTLVNPARMTRQAHEFAGDTHPARGHLTGFDPLRPENAPDAWEEESLHAFAAGAEKSSVTAELSGEEHFRLMRPLEAEEGCLRCHDGRAYVPGAFAGGISVSIPMAPLRAIERRNAATLALAHAALWTVGMAALLLGGRALLRSETARSEAEEETRRYAKRLEESNRLKELFADIMRHDLINPTGIIRCYADYILERETDDTTRDYGLKIRRTSDRLIRMIEDASLFTHLRDAGEMECEDLDLAAVVQEVFLDLADRYEEAGIAASFQYNGSARVRANPMIGAVFGNLFSNALKYAGDGGRVDVSLEAGPAHLTVAVADRGPGIAGDDKERVFRRFERLRKNGVRGSGLGLAIARHLVELHGGRIWVEDNPGGGARFLVCLPRGGPRRPRLSAPAPAAAIA